MMLSGRHNLFNLVLGLASNEVDVLLGLLHARDVVSQRSVYNYLDFALLQVIGPPK